MSDTKWIDRQIDEALLTATTATGLLYARRQARRVMPKVVVGGAIVAAVGTVAAVAAAGLGVIGAGAAGVAWYRHNNKRSAEQEWRPPMPGAGSSFVATDARRTSPAAAE